MLDASDDQDALYRSLADPSSLTIAWRRDAAGVLRSWRKIRAGSDYHPLETYQGILENPTRDIESAKVVASLLEDLEYLGQAYVIWAGLAAFYREHGNQAELAAALNSQAYLLRHLGDLDGALALHREQQEICRALEDPVGLAMGRGNEALVVERQGDSAGALALNQEALDLCGDLASAAKIRAGLIINRGSLLEATGDEDRALACYEEGARLASELNRLNELGISLGNEARIRQAKGDLPGALATLQRLAKVFKDLEHRDRLADNLEDQVKILLSLGRQEEALAALAEWEPLFRASRRQPDAMKLFWCLFSRISVFAARSDWPRLLSLARDVETLARQVGNRAALRHALTLKAAGLFVANDLEGALSVHQEEEALCRELGDHTPLISSVSQQAFIANQLGDDARALALYRRAEQLCRERGHWKVVKLILEKQAQILSRRHVRVFVSSTFRDMFGEREQLVKFTFPDLRKVCEDRGVVLDEVDLRWGIPDEEKAEDKILPLCLEEIHRCRPYFIGLLGERYGTSVQVPRELLEREPWLKDHAEDSVTELEFLHGALNKPQEARHAFFYFRDSTYLTRLPEDSVAADFISTDAESSERLRKLKERVRSSGLSIREGYRDPEQLGEWVAEDLGRLINEMFPADQDHDPVAAAHAQFAAIRRRHWVGRKAELRRLDEMLAGSSAVLVTGPRGVGVSSFLANWAAAWRNAHPGTLVVEHYVGAHPAATSLDGCCRQLCLGLAAGRGWPAPSVTVEREWPDLFIESLALAAAQGPVLLLIDSADALKGRGEDAHAEWLPLELPAGAQIVASAGEQAIRALERRGWPALRLTELSAADRAAFISGYLADYGKKLSSAHTSRIVEAPATGNPFFLTLLLEELRNHGNFDTLGERLAELLATRDVTDLCHRIFARCEADYDRDDTAGLTARALSLLATARIGLSDAELCEILDGAEGPLPQRPWTMLQHALQRMLISRDGLIGFAQADAARAAQQRYVPTAELQRPLHRQLANYFQTRPASPHAAVELPFHLQQLVAWDELADWLSRADAFTTAWKITPEEVCRAWMAVEHHSPRRAAPACAALPPSLHPAAMNLLRQLGDWEGALTLARNAREQALAAKDPALQLQTLLTVGEVALEAGSLYDAEDAFSQAEDAAAALGDSPSRLRAMQGRRHALGSLLRAGGVDRVELGRRYREVGERVMSLFKGDADPALEAEATVLWLEDVVITNSLALTDLAQDFFRWMLPAPESSSHAGVEMRTLLEKQFSQHARRMDQRLGQLEEAAIDRLRYTRHRGLALRAEVVVAKARGDTQRLRKVLEALRQHAAARGDNDILAGVYEELTKLTESEEKLRWLEAQADLLERAGRNAALVHNRWQQAMLLWPGLGRRAEAEAMMLRIAHERHVLPRRKEKLRWTAYRLRLWLEGRRKLLLLARLGLRVLALLWLWSLWRFCAWTATWSLRLPLFAVFAYLLALLFASPPLLFLVSDLEDGWKVIRGKLKLRSAPARRAAARAPGASRVELRSEDDVPKPLPLRALFALSAGLWRLNYSISRTSRIGKKLGLDGVPARLTWYLLATPIGLALTWVFWQTNGYSRIALLPIGCASQLLALQGVLGLGALTLRRFFPSRRPGRRTRSNRIGMACLLALIRLKRRLFGRRKRS